MPRFFAGYKLHFFLYLSQFVFQADGNGGHQSVLAHKRLVAGVHQQKAAGAVGVFGFARFKAGLAEQGL